MGKLEITDTLKDDKGYKSYKGNLFDTILFSAATITVAPFAIDAFQKGEYLSAAMYASAGFISAVLAYGSSPHRNDTYKTTRLGAMNEQAD